MAQLFSTGPANFYVSLETPTIYTFMADLLTYPAKNTIAFLGTCERPPAINIIPSYLPIKADLGGPDIPFDHLFTGEIGVVTGTFNRFNEAVYAKIAARPRVNGTRGTYSAKDMGSPVMLKGPGFAYNLWVQFPFARADAKGTAYSTMVPGYRFFGATLFGPDVIQSGAGSRRLLTFWCGRVYKKTLGTWHVYNHDMFNPADGTNALPATPPVSPLGILS